MEKFLGNFDPEFIGLTGTEEEIRAAEKAAGIPPAQFDTEDGKPDPDGDYTVSHAGQVLAFAPTTGATPCTRSAPAPASIRRHPPSGGDQTRHRVEPRWRLGLKTGEAGATSTTEPTTQWAAPPWATTISDARGPEPTGPNGVVLHGHQRRRADRLLGATTRTDAGRHENG